MELDLKNILKSDVKINAATLGRTTGRIWGEIHTLLFFALLVVFGIFGWKVWQQSLLGTGWSAQKKQAYLNAQDKGVVFGQDDFNKVIAQIQERKDENNTAYQPIKDIFKPY